MSETTINAVVFYGLPVLALLLSLAALLYALRVRRQQERFHDEWMTDFNARLRRDRAAREQGHGDTR